MLCTSWKCDCQFWAARFGSSGSQVDYGRQWSNYGSRPHSSMPCDSSSKYWVVRSRSPHCKAGQAVLGLIVLARWQQSGEAWGFSLHQGRPSMKHFSQVGRHEGLACIREGYSLNILPRWGEGHEGLPCIRKAIHQTLYPGGETLGLNLHTLPRWGGGMRA